MKKILITSLSVLAAALLLCACGPKEPVKDTSLPLAESASVPPEEFCNQYVGTWTAQDGEFITFDMVDGVPAFFIAVWDAGAARGIGTVERVEKNSEGGYVVSILHPAQPASEMYEAMPEERGTFTLADSKEVPNSIFVTYADDNSKVYTNDPERQFYITGPDEDEGYYGESEADGVTAAWQNLEGYWTAPDGGDFVGFFTTDGQRQIVFGVWNAGGGRGYGDVTSFEQVSDTAYELFIHYPYVAETEAESAYEELYLTARVILETESGTEAVSVLVDDWGMDALYYRGGIS